MVRLAADAVHLVDHVYGILLLAAETNHVVSLLNIPFPLAKTAALAGIECRVKNSVGPPYNKENNFLSPIVESIEMGSTVRHFLNRNYDHAVNRLN